MHTKTDIIKDILFFLVTVCVAFGYVLFLLLLISFFAGAYIRLKIEDMFILAGSSAAIVAILDAVKRIKKYRSVK